MKRLFVMCSQEFYPGIVERLRARGHQLCLLYATELPGVLDWYRQHTPEAELALSFELHAAKLPVGSKSVLEPPRVRDLDALAPWEAVTLQMMDRRNYDGKPVQELRNVFLRYVSLWRALIDAHRPDAVLFHGTPHQGHDFVLYHLCRLDGIQTIIAERTYLNECVFMRRSLEDSVHPPADELQQFVEDIGEDSSLQNGDLNASYYDSLNRNLNDLKAIHRELSLWRLASFFLDPRAWPGMVGRVENSIHGLSQKRPRRFVFRCQEVRGRLHVRRGLRAYCRLAQQPDLRQDYLYFPLHYQPERTTVPDGGRFSDQLFVAELIAAALPNGWKLYVKEHPRQFRRGMSWNKVRNTDFYERLAKHPRISLVPLEESADRLIAGSRAVATITGTAGWEAVQAGKPAFVFGYPWYLHSPGVFAIQSSEQAAGLLDRLARGELPVDRRLVAAFATAIRRRYAFRGCFSSTLLRMSQLTADENAEAFADAYERALLHRDLGLPIEFASSDRPVISAHSSAL